MDIPVLTKEERKAKREARRQKQRENNVLRASKMHKLRLTADAPAQTKNKPQKPLLTISAVQDGFTGTGEMPFTPKASRPKTGSPIMPKPSRPLRSTLHSIHGRQRPL
jgi:hypothetical protein